jgi:hypothetical protein
MTTKSKRDDTEQLKEDLAVARADLRAMHVLAVRALEMSRNAGGLADYTEYHASVKGAVARLSAALERSEGDSKPFDPRGWHNAKLTTLLPIKERLEELLETVSHAVDQAEKREQTRNKSQGNLRRIAGQVGASRSRNY